MDNQEVTYGWNEDVYRNLMVIGNFGLKELQLMLLIMFKVQGKQLFETDFDVDDLATFMFWSLSSVFTTLNSLEEKNIITRSRGRRHNKSHGKIFFNTNHNTWLVKYRCEEV